MSGDTNTTGRMAVPAIPAPKIAIGKIATEKIAHGQFSVPKDFSGEGGRHSLRQGGGL